MSSGPSLGDLSDKKRGKFGWFSHSSETHGEKSPPDLTSLKVLLTADAAWMVLRFDLIGFSAGVKRIKGLATSPVNPDPPADGWTL